MFEDISHSGDGGIYAELIRNRAFQGSGSNPDGSLENPIFPNGPTLTGWHAIGNVTISLTQLYPLSDALPVALKIEIGENATGEVGVSNEGFWGMDVRPQTYNASFYARTYGIQDDVNTTTITLSLRSNTTGEVWAKTQLGPTKLSAFEYQQYEAQIANTATAPTSNNSFAITWNAAEAAGNTYFIDLVSLFPETYKNTKIRKDLGQLIEDLGTKFFRFPGGNNLEGQSIDTRWKWNETIGPLIDRPGRPLADWGYSNTNGLGLMEFLELCEAAHLQPLLGVYAGYSLDHTSYPEDRMQSVLDDILNELEFLLGDTSTTWGAKRAAYGHPEPYELNYVEIGNEDWFSETYPYRFPILYDGIKKAYPHLTLISTAFDENADYNISVPSGAMWDKHDYQTPSFFLENFDLFDNWQEDVAPNPNVTVFIGESSVYQYDVPSGNVNFSRPEGIHIAYPNLISAIGEGVYLLGAERNPNTVRFSTYAPSFANLNSENWTPNLITFTANPDETVKSSSYYMEQLFARHHGYQTVPVTTVSGDFNPLWWVADIDEQETKVHFKVINSGNSSVSLDIAADRALGAANGTTIQAQSLQSFNFVDHLTDVVPQPITNLPSPSGQTFTWNVPPFSVNVVQFALS